MKRWLAVLSLAAVGSVVLAATAAAKGPSQATVDGPGLDKAIVLSGDGEPEPGTTSPLGKFAIRAGYIPAVFTQTPDPMLAGRPKGDLGPRYTITYRVPGPDGGEDTIRQDLYPYADGGPVTYMKPGQPIFDMATHGGWYRAEDGLKTMLVDRGLPATSPASGGDDGSSWISEPWGVTLVAVFGAALLAAASIVLVRRRPRAAGA